ncbi:F-box only protein 6 [Camellia lanceoleosa]|uniref:F-box only protein 6 n=1 Tax=Camellia lanceoleosa TaxID=1840588 RepID=A0ACC0GB94_9ERIC|nr:F-box only protein 6 [Camellia lanceoleosa]
MARVSQVAWFPRGHAKLLTAPTNLMLAKNNRFAKALPSLHNHQSPSPDSIFLFFLKLKRTASQKKNPLTRIGCRFRQGVWFLVGLLCCCVMLAALPALCYAALLLLCLLLCLVHSLFCLLCSACCTACSVQDFIFNLRQIRRCCFFNLDDNSAEDGCYSFTIRPEKPRTFKMLEPSKPPHAKKSRKERNLGRLADATGSTEIMEHQIWKEFPEDLYGCNCKTSHCHFLPLPLCL